MYNGGGGRCYTIKDEDYISVVDYFNNNNDNQSRSIAKNLKLKFAYVDYIIDVYLSKKRNYMGTIPVIVSGGHGNRKKVKVYNKNGDVIDIFDSVAECSRELKISSVTVSKHLNNPTMKNHKGYTFKYYNVNKIS